MDCRLLRVTYVVTPRAVMRIPEREGLEWSREAQVLAHQVPRCGQEAVSASLEVRQSGQWRFMSSWQCRFVPVRSPPFPLP